jgi:hypothetical protein
MLRIGLTCIVWYADLKNPVEIKFRANFRIVFEIPNFQTVASKIPPPVSVTNFALGTTLQEVFCRRFGRG